MKTFKCDTCGPVDHVLLDGYPVGDRLLEGVLFEIRFTKNGKSYTASTTKDDAEYMSQLNVKRWRKEMVEYAKGTDIASCPKCDGDVDVADLLTKVPRPASPTIEIKMTGLPDILRRL